eukprot:gene15368-biopygen16523
MGYSRADLAAAGYFSCASTPRLLLAGPTDYLSRVAWLAGIPLDKFMLDNTAAVKDLDESLMGVNLLLCGAASGRIAAGGPGSTTDPQLESLLRIKRSIDRAGVLKSWSRQAGQDKGYCRNNWVGVSCSDDGQVVYKLSLGNNIIQGRLQGQLPPASAFRGLPGLKWFAIYQQPGMVGTLPADWSNLLQLQDVWLSNNSLTGTLPPSWGQLKQLKVLSLWGNKLSGPLPDAYKALTALQKLELGFNALAGTLPPSWGQLRQLQV